MDDVEFQIHLHLTFESDWSRALVWSVFIHVGYSDNNRLKGIMDETALIKLVLSSNFTTVQAECYHGLRL